MSRRKSRQEVERASVSSTSADETENNKMNGETSEGSDDPLAIEIDSTKSTKRSKTSKKSPAKRSSSVKRKQGGKRAKQDDEVTEKSPAKRSASKKKEENETNRNGDDKNIEDEEQEDEQSNEEEDYEVESIVDVRFVKSGAREFLIHWKNCSSDDDTWEPEDNLSCPDLITEFMDNKPLSMGKTSKKKEVKKSKQTKKVKEISAEPLDSTVEYEVEKIIEVHHKRNGGKEFLIRWKGCTSAEDSWEPEENLSCPDLISKFMEKVGKLSNVDTREIRVAPKHTQRFTLTMKSTGRRTSKRNDNKQRTTYYDAE